MREQIAHWWRKPLLCRFGLHAWGPVKTRPCSGFTIAWQLVNGTEVYRNCRKCGKYDGDARANG